MESMYGRHILLSRNAEVDHATNHRWLRISGLKAETKGFILPVQDQCWLTKNYQANICLNNEDQK